MRLLRSRARLAGLCLAVLSRAVAAQSDTAAASAARNRDKTFFVSRDLRVAGLFVGVSAGLSLLDARIARNFQDTTWLHVRLGEKLDGIFTHINESTLTVGGLAVYGIAKLANKDDIADAAFHAASAVVAASLSAQVIRGPLGRTRPKDTAEPYDQYEFHFMKGFRHFQQRAFPSIHSGSGFAAASAIVEEVNRHNPGARYWVGIPVYVLAATPGLSRMYLGQHWASDIVSGAILGTFYGRRVVQYSHSHPTTRPDRIFLGHVNSPQLDFANGQFGIGWSFQF